MTRQTRTACKSVSCMSLSLCFLTGLMMCGCANVSDDPRRGGLAGGIKGIATGAYERRLEEKRVAINDLEQAEADLASRVGASETKLQKLDNELRKRKVVLQKLREGLARVDTAIRVANSSIAQRQGILGNVELANLRKASTLKDLKAERDALERMIAELEADHQKQAALYNRSRGGADNVRVAASERKASDIEKKYTEAQDRLEKLQVSALEIR